MVNSAGHDDEFEVKGTIIVIFGFRKYSLYIVDLLIFYTTMYMQYYSSRGLLASATQGRGG